MVHLETWMAASALALFVPQLVFVPLLPGSINRRNADRVWMLRQLSVSPVTQAGPMQPGTSRADTGIERVFELDMGIFRLKFTMNFLQSPPNHHRTAPGRLVRPDG